MPEEAESSLSLSDTVGNWRTAGVLTPVFCLTVKLVTCLVYGTRRILQRDHVSSSVARDYGDITGASHNRERKCADTIGTVMVPGAGHF